MLRTAHVATPRILTARNASPGMPSQTRSSSVIDRTLHQPTADIDRTPAVIDRSSRHPPAIAAEHALPYDRPVDRIAHAPLPGRRRFLKRLLAGGPAAVLAACGDSEAPTAPPPPTAPAPLPPPAPEPPEVAPFFKDTAPFIERGNSLEARLEDMPGVITPNDLFFVRNNGGSLGIHEPDWRLVIEGDAVEKAIEVSYEGIRTLPPQELTAYLECAGNHRAMFDRVQGRAAEGTQWGTGGIGNGVWRGARLADVLELAGVTPAAASVLLIGLDSEAPEGGFRRALPAEKALADVLLAYELNGEPLPRDHGFPVRALVPGWVGSSSIKWLGRIEVSSEPHWTRNNTGSYVLIGPDYPPEGRAMGQIATVQTIKSALALPWPAELGPGPHVLHGFAQSPEGRIDRVEWSDDGGATWNEARVTGGRTELSWRRFELDWAPAPGNYTVMTRATDHTGATQPESVPFNRKGYLFNRPLPHPIRVG